MLTADHTTHSSSTFTTQCMYTFELWWSTIRGTWWVCIQTSTVVV